MFEWKRKQLEDEQIKFFGGERKKFVSCYVRKEKPRIRIKNKESVKFDLNPGYSVNSAAQLAYIQQRALASMGAMNQINLANLAAQGQAQRVCGGASGGLISQGAKGVLGGLGWS